MRVDPNFRIFAGHFEWYYLDKKKGYVPKEGAPENVVKAIKKFNSYTFPDKMAKA